MQIPLQISYRNFAASEAISAVIRKKAENLEKFYNRIISCRVMVETPHRNHLTGNIFRVRIDLTVPGEELVVSREPEKDGSHKDVYVSIRDAFNTMRRELQDYLRRRRSEVKTPSHAPHAVVSRLIPTGDDQSYGFIRTADGRDIYFHQNSVVDDHYRDLKVGTEVRFAEELGDEGPQASTVEIVGRDSGSLV